MPAYLDGCWTFNMRTVQKSSPSWGPQFPVSIFKLESLSVKHCGLFHSCLLQFLNCIFKLLEPTLAEAVK